ncbi:MAG: acyl-ACP--UDP-N-acetylglucosamine O-acyltransferase [Gemmataceae bacterium]
MMLPAPVAPQLTSGVVLRKGFLMASQIHPTAIVPPEADIADGCTIGPYAVLEGPVRLGPDSVVRAHAHLIGPLTAGSNNDFGTGCVIGDRPQHLGYRGEETGVVIGDGNIFREHVTVHRGMPTGDRLTKIGNRNLFMTSAHVGHDVLIGSDSVFVTACTIGGHAQIGDRVTLSAFSGVHQFSRIGRLAFLSGWAGSTQDTPPFWMIREINRTVGVNIIGMRRAGVPSAEIAAIRACFRMIYLEKMLLSLAMQRMEATYGAMPAVQELIGFIRTTKRGIPGPGSFRSDDSGTGSSHGNTSAEAA